MNDFEREHLRLVARYKANQMNPEWDEQMLNILNAAIAEVYELLSISSAGKNKGIKWPN